MMRHLLNRFCYMVIVCLTSGQTSRANDGMEVHEVGAVRYLIYRIPVAEQSRLELHWLDKRNQPLSNFGGLQAHLAANGKAIAFATNAGIYERGPKPNGLTICQGKEEVPLSLVAGEGNFYLLPNGVFFVDDKVGAGVMESTEYAKAGLKPRIACQSGPLLLRKGVMHPAFNPNSTNLRQRSAVGVRKSDGEIVFVVTDRKDPDKRRVSFHQLATFFLSLGCEDALFLDGDLSDFVANPPTKAVFGPQTYAGMFVLVKK